MRVKLTRAAAIKPLFAPDLLTDITGKAFGFVRITKREAECVRVRLVDNRERLRSANNVKIEIAVVAVVAEAVATAVAGVAIELTAGIIREWEEREGVSRVGCVGD